MEIIKTIKDIHQISTLKVKIAEELTDTIEFNTEIRLGDSFSPLLFNMIMDEITNKVKAKKVFPDGSKNSLSLAAMQTMPF